MRHYAEDRLIDHEEMAECQTRHYRHFVEVVRSVPFLMGDFRGLNSAVIRPESANIDAAVQRAQERGDHAAVALLVGLGSQAYMGNLRISLESAIELIESSLEHVELPNHERGPVMMGAAAAHLALGHYRQSREALDIAVGWVDDPPPQWGLTAMALQLLPEIILDPSKALDALDRLQTEVAPQVPDPSAAEFLLADYRSMALVRLRRYFEITGQNAEALERARGEDIARGAHAQWMIKSGGLIAAHLGGRPDLATPFLPFGYNEAQARFWYPYLGSIGECLHVADTVGLKAARSTLARAATNDSRSRLAIGDSAYLIGFARLAHLDDDDETARRYLDAAAVLTPHTAAIAAETLAAIERWPDEDYFDRSTQDILSRQSQERRGHARRVVPELLRNEISRWTE